jgi:quinol monooxygenase YgiN
MVMFTQVIEFDTARIDEVRALADRFREERMAAGGDGAPVRVMLTADRDRPHHYLNVVQFPSYDAAMANSDHPLTQKFAAEMTALCDGPPEFHNLDVIDGWET